MKILIIRYSSIGDVVLTEPVSYIIKMHYPEAKVDYLTKPAFVSLVQSFRAIDSIHTEKSKELYKEKYDIVLDLHRKLRSYIITKKINAKRIIRYDKKHLLRWLIIKKFTFVKISSTLDLYLSTLKKIGLNAQRINPVLIPRNDEKVLSFFNKIKNKKPLLVIFPGAQHPTKMYPKDYIINFIRLVKGRYNIVLAGGKQDVTLCKEITGKIEGIKDISGKLNLKQLIVFVSKSDLILSNDSGPMHIAAALSKPQIAIFGSTSTKLGFAPLNEKAVVLEKNLPCRPCTLHGRKACPLKHFRCMKDISFYQVNSALKKLEDKYSLIADRGEN